MTKTLKERIARARRIAAKALLLAALLAVATVAGQEIALPAAQTDGGKPLMQALKERRTTRSFAEQPLPAQVLSNLLWAAFGVNRPDGHRTAPSARNGQEIDLYVALREGLFVYDAKAHALKRIHAQDLRAAAGTQSHAREAPVTLVYVADERRMSPPGRPKGESLSAQREGHPDSRSDDETRRTFAAADTGFIAQNVYLFCASEGLGTVVYASIDRARFAQAAGLAPEQKIVLAQSIGYPKR